MDSVQWEQSKENVLPLKRGRSTKCLSESLSKPVTQTSALEQETEHHQKILEDSLKRHAADPKKQLESYVIHLKWVRDRFPTNSERALKVLEQCTCDLKDSEILKNDPIFVKMWIEYADLVKTPGEIFSFMQSNKIGERIALFWMAWAFVAEKFENFKLADQIFQKGIKKQAEPKDILQKRYQQFQRRMARHFINKMEEGVIDEPEEAKPKTVLQTIAVSNENNNVTNMRQPSVQKPKTTVNSQFTVFMDEEPSRAVDALAENRNWKSLGKDSERRKENDAPVSKWSEAPLEYHSDRLNGRPQLVSHSSRSGAVPAIKIFVDPEPEQPLEGAIEDKEAAHIRRKLDGATNNQLKVHSTASDLERISVDPLSRHKGGVAGSKDDEPQRPAADVHKSKSASSAAKSKLEEVKAVKEKGSEKSTSTNSAATPALTKQGFEIFADDMSPAANRVEKSSKPAQAVAASSSSLGAFTIFSDDTGSNQNNNEPKQASAPKERQPRVPAAATSKDVKSSSFTILADDAVVNEPTKGIAMKTKPSSSQQSAVRPTASMPIAPITGAKFAIFSDDAAVELANNSKPDVKIQSQPQQAQPKQSQPAFAIFADGDADSGAPAPLPAQRKQSAAAASSFTIFADNDQSKPQQQPSFGISSIRPPAAPQSSHQQHRSPHHQQQHQQTPVRDDVMIATPDISVHEDELDQLLADMGVGLDGEEEDGTINTRLAKKDIDSMFCSPQAVTSSASRLPITAAGAPAPSIVSASAARNVNNKIPTDVQIGGSMRRVKTEPPMTTASFARRSFEGSDLSAIPEASCEYSMMCGPLTLTMSPDQLLNGLQSQHQQQQAQRLQQQHAQPSSRLSTICKASGSGSGSEGFSIFCDDTAESPAVGFNSNHKVSHRY